MGMQQGAEKSGGRGRPRPRGAQHGARRICNWGQQEAKELSRLILGYVQRNGGKLPTKGDAAFWAFCSDRFQGRCKALQVHDKACRLKFRFLQLSSGQAKAIKLYERDIFQVWAQIMNYMNASPQVTDHNAGNNEGGQPAENSSNHAENNPPNTQIPRDQAGRTTGTNGMEGPSKGNTPRAGGDKGGVGVAGEACARKEEGQGTSTCSTENVFEESQNSYGTYTMHADDDVDVPPDVGASAARNMTLFQHIIAADLAATTKTLAEFVHSQATT